MGRTIHPPDTCSAQTPPARRRTALSVAIMRFFIVRLLSPATADTTWPGDMKRAALMPYTDLVHRKRHSPAWR